MSHWLAQINIGRLVAPPGDPRVAEFVNALDIRYSDDSLEALNMSVWESVEALLSYAYSSKHVDFFRRRAEWFEKHTAPHYCLWWVPEGHIPTVAEGIERLEHYRRHGATGYAFWFSQKFPAPELAAAQK